MYFDNHDIELQDTEPFALDNLARYKLTDGALEAMVQGDDLLAWRNAVLASGQVMSGVLGEEQVDRDVQRAENIYLATRDYLNSPVSPLSASLTIQDTKLYLNLPNVYDDRIIEYRAGRLQDRHLLSAWLKHLAANALGAPLQTVCIHRGTGDEATGLILDPVDQETCMLHLEVLLDLYRKGVTQPLFLPPETSRAYAENYSGPDTAAAAIIKAKDKFSREQPGAEGLDRYWTRLFTVPGDLEGDFQHDVLLIWRPLLEHVNAA